MSFVARFNVCASTASRLQLGLRADFLPRHGTYIQVPNQTMTRVLKPGSARVIPPIEPRCGVDCGHRCRPEGAFRERAGRWNWASAKQPRPPPHRVVGLVQQPCHHADLQGRPESIHVTDSVSCRGADQPHDDLAADRPNTIIAAERRDQAAGVCVAVDGGHCRRQTGEEGPPAIGAPP
jgi:hypothetical protein